MKDELLTIKDAATLLGVSTKTLRRWETSGHLIPQRTFGNQRRYSKSDLTALLDSSKGKVKLASTPSQNVTSIAAPVVEQKQSLPLIDSLDQENLVKNPVVNSFKINGFPFHFEKTFTAGTLAGLVVFIVVIVLFTLGQGSRFLEKATSLLSVPEQKKQLNELSSKQVLGASDTTPEYQLSINVPGVFGKTVTFLDTVAIKKGLSVDNVATLSGGIITKNANINAGKGKLTASNVVYSIRPGANISISGDPQNPIISTTGAGNAGVTSLQGETGAVTLTGGSGISISGATITNSDTGSAQNIFKTFSINGTDIAAGSNNDTINFAAGSGISLSGDAGSKTITITGTSAQGSLTGLTPNGVLYAATSNSAATVVGTSGTVLHGVTNGVPVFSSVDLTADVSNILPIANGGTGIADIPNDGEILIGNGAGYQLGTITGGAGIGITDGSGSITLANNGVISLTGTTNQITVSGSGGAFSLALPQDIANTSTPTFSALNLNSNANELTLGNGNTATITLAGLTGSRTYTFPDASGTVCLTSGNCTGSGGALTGSGDQYYIPVFTGASGIGDSDIYDNGKVGIGTTSPQGLFSVSGGEAGLALVNFNSTNEQDILVGSASGVTRFVFDTSGDLGINGGNYEINGTPVLSSSTLGSTVTGSSLTSVGNLVGGSLTTGFGSIAIGSSSISGGDITSSGTTGYISNGTGAGLTFNGTGNHFINASSGTLELGITQLQGEIEGNGQDITGVDNFSASGTIKFSGLSTGIVHAASDGTLSSSAVGLASSDVTGILPIANGGTNGNATPTAGGVAYGTGTAYGFSLAGTAGDILVSAGTGAPIWESASTVVTNYWQLNSGALSPMNETNDLLLGSTATGSAKFAFTGVDSGTPTASISAQTSPYALSLSSNGNIFTTGAESLTLGSASTGNIVFGNGLTTGIAHISSGGVLSSSAVNLNSGDVTGTLPVGNGGTGQGSFTAGGLLYGNGSGALGVSAQGTTGQALVSGGSGSPTWTTGALALAGNFSTSGTNALTLTTTGVTNATLPSGSITLVDLSSSQALTSKTINGLSLTSEADGFEIAGGTTSRTLTVSGNNVSLDQDLLTTSSPTFGGLTLSGFTAGVIQSNGLGVISEGQVTNAELQNDSVTIQSSGAGLSVSGSPLALGGTLTLQNTGVTSAVAGTGISLSQGTGAVTINNTGVTSVTGTANQVLVNGLTTAQTGAVTLTLPQSIATNSNPTFASVILGSGDTGTIGLDTLTGSHTYDLPDFSGPSADICLSTGNCIGGSVEGIGGSGAANYIAMFSDTSHVESSGLYQLNGSLGLGTTTPIGALDIQGAPAGQALTVLDYTGTDQNILVASTSGAEQFAINNNGSFQFAGGSGFLQTLTASATASKIYNLPDFAGTNADICLSTGNCSGAGSGVTGSGVTGQLAFFSGSSSISSDSTLSFDDTHKLFGVGTTTPVSTLDVNGAYGGNAAAIINQLNSGNIFTASSSGTTEFTIGHDGILTAAKYTTNNGLLYTNGSGVIEQQAAAGTDTQVLLSNSGTPTFTSLSGDASISDTGVLSLKSVGPGAGSYGSASQTLEISLDNQGRVTGLTPTAIAIAASQITSGQLGVTNGGTGIGSINEGDLLYGSASNTLSALSISGTSGECLVSNGTIPGWASCPGGGSVNYWQQTNGALSPLSETNDLLLGSTATGSAKFAFSGVDGGTPTASISAQTSPYALSLSSNGNIFTTGAESLTLGAASTGNIVFGNGLLTGIAHISSGGVLSSGAVNLNSLDVTGTLPVTNGGTGANTAFTQGSIVFAGSSGVYSQDNNNFFYNSTKALLGLGTNAPVSRLDVEGAIAGKALSIFNYTGSDQNILVASTSGTEEFAVNNNGNFQFSGNSGFLNTLSTTTAYGSFSSGQTYAFPSTGGTICIVEAGNCAGSGGGVTGSGTANRLAKFTAGGVVGNGSINDLYASGVALTIDTNGNLGIGTSAPVAALDVNGSYGGNAAAIINQLNTGNIFTASASGATEFTIAQNGNFQFSGNSGFLNTLSTTTAYGSFSSGQTYAFPSTGGTICIVEAGNCAGSGGGVTGSGTANRLAKFTAGGVVGNGSINDLYASGVALTIDTNGNLGIGTSAPVAALDVNGSYGGNAAAIINQLNTGNIFTASASGATEFTIAQNGNITANGTIGGLTGITSSGAIDFSGLGSGVVQSASGTLSASNLNLATGPVTGILGAANGGTGFGTYSTGDLLVGNGTSTLSILGSGTGANGKILEVVGGTPEWETAGGTLNYWQENGGAVSPFNITDDLLLGSTASGSAKFAFKNVAGGTPTASISAVTTPSALSLDANGNIFTTGKQSLTLGAASTGNITIDSPTALNLNTTNGAAITTGGGLTTLGGNLEVNGNNIEDNTAANRISFSSNQITLGGSTATLSDTSLATFTTSASLAMSSTTTLTLGGSPTINGGTGSSGTLTLVSTTNGTKGNINFFTGAGSTSISSAGELNLAGGQSPDITTSGSNANLTIQPNGTGQVITGNATSGLVIGATTSTSFPLLVNDGIGNNAELVVNQKNNGDIIDASQGGNLKFQITNGGTVNVNGGIDTIASGGTLTLGPTNATAINFGVSQNPTYTFTGTGTFQTSSGTNTLGGNVTINGTTVNIGAGSSGIIQAASGNSNLSLAASGNGTLFLKTTYQSGVEIGASIGSPQAPLFISGGIGNNGALIVNNTNSGDLIDASASGTTNFAVNNNGDIQFAGGGGAGNLATLAFAGGGTPTITFPNITATVCLSTDNCGYAGGSNFWQYNAGALAPAIVANDFLLGGNSTASAKFAFIGNAGSNTPVASISAQSGTPPNGLAMSPGSIQSLNMNTLTIGGSSTGNIAITPNNGSGGLLTINAATESNAATTINLTGTNPVFGATASNSTLQVNANGNGTLTLNGNSNTGNIQFFGSTIGTVSSGGVLSLKGGNAADIATLGSNNNLSLAANGTGTILLTTGITAGVDIGASVSGPKAPLFINGGIGNNGALIINNNNSGDLIDASKSGTLEFSVDNAGDVVLSGTTRITNAGVGTFAASTVVDTDTFTANTITDSGALSLTSSGANTLTLQSAGTGNINFFGASTGSFSSGGVLTLKGNNAADIITTGTNPLSLDTAGSAAINIGNTHATSLAFGNTTSNPSFGFNGTGGFTVNGGGANNITFGSSTGNSTVVVQPNAGGQASLIIKNQGSGDLLTASAGATTKFVVNSNGNIQLTGNSGFLNTISTTGSFASGQTYSLPNAGGTFCLSTNNCGYATGSNFWQYNAGALSPAVVANDFLLGGNSTASAKFAFIGNAGSNTPVASISAQSGTPPNGLAMSPGSIQSLNMNTLTIGGSSTGNIAITPNNGTGGLLTINAATTTFSGTTINATSATALNLGASGSTITVGNGGASTITTSGAGAENLTLTAAGTGNIILSSDFNSGVDIGSSSNTPAILSVSGGIGNNAAFIVNNINNGDLIDASQSSNLKFQITNGGQVNVNGTIDTLTGGTLTLGGSNATEVDATPLLKVNGGLTVPSGKNFTLAGITTNNEVLYGTPSTGVVAGVATTSTPNQCLESGTTTPSWVACPGATPQNYWQTQNSGVIAPFSTTADVVLGGIATSSADFAFTGVDSNAPIASISAFTNLGNKDGISLSANNATIQALNMNTLTLGGSSTGNLALASNTISLTGTAPIIDSTNGALNINTLSSQGILLGVSSSTTTVGGNLKLGNNNILDSGGTTRINVGATTTLTNTQTTFTGTTTFLASSLATFTTSAGLSMGSTTGLTLGGNATIYGGTGASSTLTLAGTSNGSPSNAYVLLNPSGQGNVGIGTTSPLAALDVRGSLGTKPVASISGKTSFAGLVVDNSGSGALFTASSSGLPLFKIDNAGNVGIGNFAATDNIGTDLTNAFGGAPSQGLEIAPGNNTAPVLGLLEASSSSAYTPGILFGAGGNYSNGAAILFNNNSNDLSFWTNDGNERMDILANGDVGIGTPAPASGDLLDVEGGNIAFGYGYGLQATGHTYTNVLTTGWNGSSDFTSLYTPGGSGNDANAVMTLAGGNVGVGTTTPYYPLEISSTATNTGLGSGFNDGIAAIDGTLTGTAYTQQNGLVVDPTISPSSTSTMTYNAINDFIYSTSSYISGAALYGIKEGTEFNAGGQIVGTETGGYFQNGTGGGTATTAYGVDIDSAYGSITNNYGLYIKSQTVGSTLNTNLAIGGNPGSGNYSIYNASSYQNYFAGTLGIGTTSIGNGELTINQPNTSGNIFSASSSGTTEFVINNNGNVGIGTTKALATLDVRALSGTLPVASVSGNTSFASLVVDNSGLGDIFTASASGTTRFTVKNSGVVVIGNTTNGITFDPTGNTTAIYTGTARPTKQVVLSAEYAGAVLTASGSAYTTNGSNGFMTSDASPSASPSTYNFENYYQWLSTQTTPGLQTYVVAVRVTLPKDFSDWAQTNPVTVDYNTSSTATNSNLNIYLYNPTSATPIAYHQGLATSGPWATNSISYSELTAGTAKWNSSNPTAVFYLTMQAWNNAYVQVGDIKLNYLAQF